MKRMKPALYKRILSYVIDLIVIGLISGVVSLVCIDTTNSNMQTSRLVDLTKRLATGEISQEEYNAKYSEVNYDVVKASVPVTAVTCIVTIVYYVVMSYFCHGITLGKFLMKLRIKGKNDRKLNLGNYLLRSLIINMLLMNITSIMLVSILSKDSFTNIYSKISNGFSILMLLSFIVMIYREDGRGLHDLISGTIVVDTKKELEESIDEVREATIIENEKKKGK